MTPEKRSDNQSLLGKLIGVLLGSPWLGVLGKVWKVLWKAMQGRFHKGLYKVLEYESTLELKDRGGKKATFKKREQVRYLRDNIRAWANALFV